MMAVKSLKQYTSLISKITVGFHKVSQSESTNALFDLIFRETTNENKGNIKQTPFSQ